jgi:hypothetical protein
MMDLEDLFVDRDYAFAELTENLLSELGIQSESLVRKDSD